MRKNNALKMFVYSVLPFVITLFVAFSFVPARSAAALPQTAIDLAVSGRAEPSELMAGLMTVVVFTTTNKLPSTANAVKTEVSLPVGAQFVSASEGCVYNASTLILVCDIGSVIGGQQVVKWMTTQTPSSSQNWGKDVYYLVDAKGDPNDWEWDPFNNSDWVAVRIAVPCMCLPRQSELGISASPVITTVRPGDYLTQKFFITNYGTSSSEATVLTYTLPSGLSIIAEPFGCSQNVNVQICDFGHLSYGTAMTKTFQLQVTGAAGAVLTSTVQIGSENEDPNWRNNVVRPVIRVDYPNHIFLPLMLR